MSSDSRGQNLTYLFLVVNFTLQLELAMESEAPLHIYKDVNIPQQTASAVLSEEEIFIQRIL